MVMLFNCTVLHLPRLKSLFVLAHTVILPSTLPPSRFIFFRSVSLLPNEALLAPPYGGVAGGIG
jgi:hypothetical protein